VLSINDAPGVRELFPGLPMEEVHVAYSISRGAKGRKRWQELIISDGKGD
jgi:hypothetical protein